MWWKLWKGKGKGSQGGGQEETIVRKLWVVRGRALNEERAPSRRMNDGDVVMLKLPESKRLHMSGNG